MLLLNPKKVVERRVRWVRALLSGEYKQGTGVLKKLVSGGAEHCCLGVGCEVIAPHSTDLSTYIIMGKTKLSWRNARKLGLTTQAQSVATIWNDTYQHSFATIADYIAYATENDLSLRSIRTNSVPKGYAREWLTKYDED